MKPSSDLTSTSRFFASRRGNNLSIDSEEDLAFLKIPIPGDVGTRILPRAIPLPPPRNTSLLSNGPPYAERRQPSSTSSSSYPSLASIPVFVPSSTPPSLSQTTPPYAIPNGNSDARFPNSLMPMGSSFPATPPANDGNSRRGNGGKDGWRSGDWTCLKPTCAYG